MCGQNGAGPPTGTQAQWVDVHPARLEQATAYVIAACAVYVQHATRRRRGEPQPVAHCLEQVPNGHVGSNRRGEH